MAFVKHVRIPRVTTAFREDEILLLKQHYHKQTHEVYKIIIYVNAWRKHFKGKLYVELYFDYESRRIGFVPLDEPTADAYKLTGKNARSFACKKFFLENDIHVGETGYMRCLLQYDGEYLTASVDPRKVLGHDCHGYTSKINRAEEIAQRLSEDTGFSGDNLKETVKLPTPANYDELAPKRRGRPAMAR